MLRFRGLTQLNTLRRLIIRGNYRQLPGLKRDFVDDIKSILGSGRTVNIVMGNFLYYFIKTSLQRSLEAQRV